MARKRFNTLIITPAARFYCMPRPFLPRRGAAPQPCAASLELGGGAGPRSYGKPPRSGLRGHGAGAMLDKDWPPDAVWAEDGGDRQWSVNHHAAAPDVRPSTLGLGHAPAHEVEQLLGAGIGARRFGDAGGLGLLHLARQGVHLGRAPQPAANAEVLEVGLRVVSYRAPSSGFEPEPCM